jgi:predicted phage terminase large subunit-like protein
VERFRGTPGKVQKRVKSMAEQDGKVVMVGIEQDPGQAGKFEAESYVTALAGWIVKTVPPQGDKETRTMPASTQAEHGKIKLVRGPWNEAFLDELENFPRGSHDDQVDALSGAFNTLTAGGIERYGFHRIQPRDELPRAIRRGGGWRTVKGL